MSDRDSFFLVIEGLDGSGKTEISRRLAELMRSTLDEHVMLTYEPHDPSAAGLYIRRVLRKKIVVSPHTLALAFALNRADHNERIITPFLEQDDRRVVLCDRYVLSSLVYNTAPDLPMQEVWDLNAQTRTPDLTLFLDATAEICYARMGSRGGNRDLFETNLAESRTRYFEAIEFLRQRGERVLVIDANPDLLLVINSIIDAIKAHGPRWMTLQKLMFLEATAPAILTPPPLELDRWMRDFIERYTATVLVDAANDDGIRRMVAAEVNRLPLDELTALMMNFLQTDRRYRFESAWPGQPIDYTAIRPGGESGGLVILQDERRWEGVVRALESDFIAPHYSIRRDSIQFLIALDPSHAGEEVAQFVPDSGSVPVEVYGRGTLIQYFSRHITRRVQAEQGAPISQAPQLSMELPDEALAEDWSLAAALAGPAAVEAPEFSGADVHEEIWQPEEEPFAATDEAGYGEAQAGDEDAGSEPGLRFVSETPPVEAPEVEEDAPDAGPLLATWGEAADETGAALGTMENEGWSFEPDAGYAAPEAEMPNAAEFAAPDDDSEGWSFEDAAAPAAEAGYAATETETPYTAQYADPADDSEGWSFENVVAPGAEAGYAAPEAEMPNATEYAAPADDSEGWSFENVAAPAADAGLAAPEAEMPNAAEYAAPADDAAGWSVEDVAAPGAEAGYAAPETETPYTAQYADPADDSEGWSFENVAAPAADAGLAAPEAEMPSAAHYVAPADDAAGWSFEDVAASGAEAKYAAPEAEMPNAAQYAAPADDSEGWSFVDVSGEAVEIPEAPVYRFAPFEELETPVYGEVTAVAAPEEAAPAESEAARAFEAPDGFGFDAPAVSHAFPYDAFAALPSAPMEIEAALPSEPSTETDAAQEDMPPVSDHSFAPAPEASAPESEPSYDPDEELPWRARRGALRSKTDSAEYKRVTDFSLPPAPQAEAEYSYDPFAPPAPLPDASDESSALQESGFSFDQPGASESFSYEAFGAPPISQTEMDEISALYSGLEEALKGRSIEPSAPSADEAAAEEEEAG